MTYALHGAHGAYTETIFHQGVSRQTAAYFLLPTECDPARLHATLACAVFHAIGLQVIDCASRYRSLLSEEIARVGDIHLFLFAIAHTPAVPMLDSYQYGPHTTYPYAKVARCGAVTAPPLAQLTVPNQLFAQVIAAEGEQPRFFQKNQGKQQFLRDCDVQMLEQMCSTAAASVAPQLTELLHQYTTGR